MHHALLAVGLLPLAFASPVANDKKHKTTTTTVTLAPVSSVADKEPGTGTGTIIHSWTSTYTPPPVTFESSTVIPPQPSTTHWSSVFTMHDSSVIQGTPTTVPVASVSQPSPEYTGYQLTSVIHTGVSTVASTTVVKSKPSPKPKLGQEKIKDTKDVFKLFAQPDLNHGKDGLKWPYDHLNSTLHLWSPTKDIWTTGFGDSLSVEPTWALHKGRLQTVKNSETKNDVFYWAMADYNKACTKKGKTFNPLFGGFHIPILSTNKAKHHYKGLNKVDLEWKHNWELVRAENKDQYTLQNSKHAGHFIFCSGYNLLDGFTHDGAGLFYGTNTAQFLSPHCQQIQLGVSCITISLLLPAHMLLSGSIQ